MMQSYKNNQNLLSEFLDYLKYKVENNMLTMSEMEGLKRAFMDNLTLTGTAEEIAEFYHKTPQDVRNIVHRKVFEKPRRMVHYNFSEFRKAVPEKWKKKS